MSKKIFISYRHNDAAWVRDTLYPVLSAGGARVIVDYRDFDAGIALRRQISERQASADVHLLVFTPDYFTSDYCVDEMRRAVATDPHFTRGTVLPIVLHDCTLPPEITGGDPLRVDLSGAPTYSRRCTPRALSSVRLPICSAARGTPLTVGTRV